MKQGDGKANMKYTTGIIINEILCSKTPNYCKFDRRRHLGVIKNTFQLTN
jgi:hypothetical protein